MVNKGRIRNEYRFAWREGNLSEIPADVIAILEAEYPKEKNSEKHSAEKSAKVAAEKAEK